MIAMVTVISIINVFLVGGIAIIIFAWLKNGMSLLLKIWGYGSFGALMVGLMIVGESADILIRAGLLSVCMFALYLYVKRAKMSNI